ncbi:hypothetical protein PINS_up014013 [Pythium insidiosum]|nr:hypothetical protein PINS_up014013 [Pythium insidiosum]
MEPSARQLADLFDDESLWDADDTDELLLRLVTDAEAQLSLTAAEMADQGGNTLLHMAAIWNRPRVMEEMIRRGIELNLRNTVRGC